MTTVYFHLYLTASLYSPSYYFFFQTASSLIYLNCKADHILPTWNFKISHSPTVWIFLHILCCCFSNCYEWWSFSDVAARNRPGMSTWKYKKNSLYLFYSPLLYKCLVCTHPRTRQSYVWWMLTFQSSHSDVSNLPVVLLPACIQR